MKLIKYHFYCLISLIIISNITLAQSPIKVWDKTIGGNNCDYCRSIVQANDGASWKEIDFGQTEDRFIHRIFINPYDNKELWIAEYPHYNDIIPQQLLYKGSDSGKSWLPITIDVGIDPTGVRVIGASSDGKV